MDHDPNDPFGLGALAAAFYALAWQEMDPEMKKNHYNDDPKEFYKSMATTAGDG